MKTKLAKKYIVHRINNDTNDNEVYFESASSMQVKAFFSDCINDEFRTIYETRKKTKQIKLDEAKKLYFAKEKGFHYFAVSGILGDGTVENRTNQFLPANYKVKAKKDVA